MRVICPGCKKITTVSDELAGKKVKCSGCSTVFRIPEKPNAVLPPPVRQSAPAPVTPQFDFDVPLHEEPRSTPHVTIEHRHKASGGAFRTGFGVTLGCLVAIGITTVGGCVVIALMVASIPDAVKEASKASGNSPSFESQMQKMQEDLNRQLDKAMPQVGSNPMQPSIQNSNTQFDFKNITMRSEYGNLRLLGEATNNSGKNYSIATLTVTLYDKHGRLVDTGHAILSNIGIGQTKSFEAGFIDTSAKQVDKYKIQFENGF